MSARREELTRQAARLFAQKGYHGTSIGEIAKALGVQKGSLYAHIESKQDLLYETMAEGARAFHGGLDAIDDSLPATEKIRLALRSHLRVVADQLDVATVFVQEWRYLEGERREEILGERRRYEERIRALFREGRELGELRSDLDDATAALLALSPRTGPTPGCGRARTPTSSPTASTRCSSTACAATRHPISRARRRLCSRQRPSSPSTKRLAAPTRWRIGSRGSTSDAIESSSSRPRIRRPSGAGSRLRARPRTAGARATRR
jgi:AcrR family transcriptional regulator